MLARPSASGGASGAALLAAVAPTLVGATLTVLAVTRTGSVTHARGEDPSLQAWTPRSLAESRYTRLSITTPRHDARGGTMHPEAAMDTDDLIVWIDAASVITAVTPALAAALGWSVAELVGQPIARIQPPPLQQLHLDAFAAYRATRLAVAPRGQTSQVTGEATLPAHCRDGSLLPITGAIFVELGSDPATAPRFFLKGRAAG
jgi:PAS domain S-box-containing protein